MVNKYIPKQGDIVFLDFNSTKEQKQKSVEYAIVISNTVFNINTKMVMLCPIIRSDKNFPTHYQLEDTKKIQGSVLCEHIRSINYEIKKLNFVEKASDNDLLSVIMLTNACIE